MLVSMKSFVRKVRILIYLHLITQHAFAPRSDISYHNINHFSLMKKAKAQTLLRLYRIFYATITNRKIKFPHIIPILINTRPCQEKKPPRCPTYIATDPPPITLALTEFKLTP